MDLKDKIKSVWSEAIIFLKGEESEERSIVPLYTKEEMDELYSVKRDLERFQKKRRD